MTKRNRYGLRVAGLIAIMVAVAGIAFLLYTDSQVAGSVVARPLGWIGPAVTVLIIAGVGWLLMGERESDNTAEPAFERVTCPECEREVLGKWRMCPYCGAMLERRSKTTVGVGQAER